MRRVFALTDAENGTLLALALEDPALPQCLVVESLRGDAQSRHHQLIARESTGAFLNLPPGAHPPRSVHCRALNRVDMQYAFSFPIKIQAFVPPAYGSVPVTTVRLPSVQMLLRVSDLNKSAAFRHAGPVGAAFDARSPKQYAQRFFMLPPLDFGLSPEHPSFKLAKPRRQLSLRDLLCVDAASSAMLLRRGRANYRRQCGVPDCYKYALTGGFCIRHGGGKRCSQLGCQTVAQSGGRCKAHGGGSKCKVPNCGSVARRRGYCMAHGGRQPCKVAGCAKCAHGGGFCISHGGGKRCAAVSCTKSAQAGGFCYSHGGGKRCSVPECFQAARKGGLCIRHRKASEPKVKVGDHPSVEAE
jgi:hypothetical protein